MIWIGNCIPHNAMVYNNLPTYVMCVVFVLVGSCGAGIIAFASLHSQPFYLPGFSDSVLWFAAASKRSLPDGIKGAKYMKWWYSVADIVLREGWQVSFCLSHYLNQWGFFYWRIYASLGLNELYPDWTWYILSIYTRLCYVLFCFVVVVLFSFKCNLFHHL